MTQQQMFEILARAPIFGMEGAMLVAIAEASAEGKWAFLRWDKRKNLGTAISRLTKQYGWSLERRWLHDVDPDDLVVFELVEKGLSAERRPSVPEFTGRRLTFKVFRIPASFLCEMEEHVQADPEAAREAIGHSRFEVLRDSGVLGVVA